MALRFSPLSVLVNPPLWLLSTEVKINDLRTLFCPSLYTVTFFGMRRECRGLPRPCFLLCVACQPCRSVQSLAFPEECDWNVICLQEECLGHGLDSDFMSSPGASPLWALSPIMQQAGAARKGAC